MAAIFREFKDAQMAGSGPALAAVFDLQDRDRLNALYHYSNGAAPAQDIRYGLLQDRVTGIKLPKQEGNVWVDVFVAFWKTARELVKLDTMSSWTKVFGAWKELANVLIRGYSTGGFQAWTIPCLYVVGKHLRVFAIKADKEPGQEVAYANNYDDMITEDSKNARLEETSRIINRMFTLCLQDRSSLEESRKWGVYSIVNLSLKTYFKLGSVSSCRSLLHAIDASQSDMPPLTAFPKSHVVTFEYYVGVIAFLEEKYEEAEEHLTHALQLCYAESKRNIELILTYLIPCRLVTTHALPTRTLLAPYPRLAALFLRIVACIRAADLPALDVAMSVGEHEFVRRRIYLPLERGRQLALRNLFRKVFLAGGFEAGSQPPVRRTRVPVAEFAAALRVGRGRIKHVGDDEHIGEAKGDGDGVNEGANLGNRDDDDEEQVDMDEVECFLANLIYKNLIKGYISRERRMVVLSKNNMAFPGTGV